MAKDIAFTITKNIATLSTSSSDWTKELNLVAWGDNVPKLDLRTWGPDHEKMGKGITLTDDEAKELAKAIKDYLEK